MAETETPSASLYSYADDFRQRTGREDVRRQALEAIPPPEVDVSWRTNSWMVDALPAVEGGDSPGDEPGRERSPPWASITGGARCPGSWPPPAGTRRPWLRQTGSSPGSVPSRADTYLLRRRPCPPWLGLPPPRWGSRGRPGRIGPGAGLVPAPRSPRGDGFYLSGGVARRDPAVLHDRSRARHEAAAAAEDALDRRQRCPAGWDLAAVGLARHRPPRRALGGDPGARSASRPCRQLLSPARMSLAPWPFSPSAKAARPALGADPTFLPVDPRQTRRVRLPRCPGPPAMAADLSLASSDLTCRAGSGLRPMIAGLRGAVQSSVNRKVRSPGLAITGPPAISVAPAPRLPQPSAGAGAAPAPRAPQGAAPHGDLALDANDLAGPP